MVAINVQLDDIPPLDFDAYQGMQHFHALIVEPSIPQQKIISQQFEGQGVFNISIVDTGEAALEEIAAAQPDLVVSAMYLEDMTGAELVTAIRENDSYEYIPFLLISSETDTRWLEPVRQAGVVGILPKPFDIRDLQRALCAAYDLRSSGQLRESSEVDFHKLEVLLVDDSMFSRNHIRRVVENLGVTNIDEAVNGIEATNMLGSKNYDLLLTDYHMPEMDGKELLEFVRAESTQQTIPALMITSEQNLDKLVELERCGPSAICDKPFEPRVIGSLIEKLLTAH